MPASSPELRTLSFPDLPAAAEEAQRLLASGYTRRGNWSLGQICRHLYLVQNGSIDGFPRWMSLFAFLRPVMRTFFLPRLLRPDSPRGIPTSPPFQPGEELNDAAEVATFVASVQRFCTHVGPFQPHPGFGRLDRETLEKVHAAHAAHHLRFLEGKTARTP